MRKAVNSHSAKVQPKFYESLTHPDLPHMLEMRTDVLALCVDSGNLDQYGHKPGTGKCTFRVMGEFTPE